MSAYKQVVIGRHSIIPLVDKSGNRADGGSIREAAHKANWQLLVIPSL